jgi:hypothetical protein
LLSNQESGVYLAESTLIDSGSYYWQRKNQEKYKINGDYIDSDDIDGDDIDSIQQPIEHILNAPRMRFVCMEKCMTITFWNEGAMGDTKLSGAK